MRWTARHRDGFTEHLLRFDLRGAGGRVEGDACWFQPGPGSASCRLRFDLDEARIAAAVPALRLMDEAYAAGWTDMDDRTLTVEVDGEAIRRHAYGAGVLVADRPELRPFVELFDWLEAEVLARLPAGAAPAAGRR